MTFRIVTPDRVRDVVMIPHSPRSETASPVRFKEGDRVVARNINPMTHTRLPRYIRGHVGKVIKHVGSMIFADARAHGRGDAPEHVYTVRFEGDELWGPDARSKDAVFIDLYDSYIEAAP